MPLLLLIFSLFTFGANAQDLDAALEITKKECQKLMRINAFNSADYVPGIDAHGRKVKGANLNGDHQIKTPDEISFDLTIDLAEKYDLGSALGANAKLGHVKVKGRDVYWNGKKLGENGNDAALKACRDQYEQK